MFELADTQLRADETAAQAPAPKVAGDAGFWETFKAVNYEGWLTADMVGRSHAMREAYDNRIKSIFDATGVQLVNPELAPWLWRDGMRRDFATKLEQLGQERPEHRAIIKPDQPIEEDAYQLVGGARKAASDLGQRYGHFVDLPLIGPLNLPGIAAGVIPKSPLQAAAMLAPLSPVRPGLAGILEGGARMGAYNAGADAIGQPWRQTWLKEAGAEYGWGLAAQEVTGQFLAGFLLDAGVRSGWRGGRKVFGYTPELDAAGKVTGYKAKSELPPQAAPAAAPADPAAPITQEALTEAAAKLPPDNPMRAAHDGDVAAMAQVAEAFGAADDPLIKGIIDHAKVERAATDPRVHLVDDGDGMARLADMLRNDGRPDAELPAGRAEPVLPARHVPLADHEPAPAAQFKIDGKSASFERVKAAELTTDAELFQFKAGGDARGVTERLRGIEQWDPVAAGRAVVWEAADGTRIVADGHQRSGLARQLESKGHAPIELDAILLREADGWTPGDVRALAAKKNLQEGSGSAIDAAKVIRERPEIIDDSVPLGSEAMRQARALAKLSDEAFGQVAAGRMPPNYAALIGDIVADKARHAGLVEDLLAAEPANIREARFALNDLIKLPTTVEHQIDLLGGYRVERSLMRERIKVLDKALAALKEDARIFGLLEREAGRIESAGNRLKTDVNAERALQAEAVGEVIEQLASTHGLVSSWLNDGARFVAQGGKTKVAAEAFAERVRRTLETEGLRGLQGEPETLRGGRGIDQPGGAESLAQIKDLETTLKPAIDRATGKEPAGQGMLFAQAEPYAHSGRAGRQMAEIKREIEKASRMLPPDVRLEVRDKLVFGDREVAGGYDVADRIVYVALAHDPLSTLSHEAVHALRQTGLMTDAEFGKLYAAAEAKGLREAYGIDERYKKIYGETVKGDALEARLREETIARMFEDYRAGKRHGAEPDGIIGRLVEFLARIREGLAGRGFYTATDVFRRIETGEMAARQDGKPVASLAADLAAVDRIKEQADLVEVCKS